MSDTTQPGWWLKPMCQSRYGGGDGWTTSRCILDPGHAGDHTTSYGATWKKDDE